MGELVHVLATNEQLIDRAFELSQQKEQPYLNQARKHSIDLKLGHVVFELQQRQEIVLLGGVDERVSA